jgi:GH18 family chitinase
MPRKFFKQKNDDSTKEKENNIFFKTKNIPFFCSAYSLAPEKLNAKLCTHLIIIGNTFVDTDGLILLPNSTQLQPYVNLKKENPELKIIICLTPDNRIMSQIVLDDNLMEQMANTLAIYLTRNNLDGFDIDWEFPVWSIDAKKTDKKGLTTLLKTIRKRFNEEKQKILLILTIGAPYTIIKKGYDINAVNQ